MKTSSKYSKKRNLLRIALGAMLVFAGTSHLTFARKEFKAQVPDWVPMDKDSVVLQSGVAEILLGLSLILLKENRKTVGWVAAAFFLAVFPGNIAQYLDRRDAFGLDTDQKRFIRLFFQPVLIAWALYSTGALLKEKNEG
ncbi:DoxX family protein [Flavobacterium rhizosphaerae]|uniref:DoxX family membrane protein n=1 Tax=Flavobacterium rhizosphaerae TaxID=3163298 RepID=A0ABW8YXV8_9FLAO